MDASGIVVGVSGRAISSVTVKLYDLVCVGSGGAGMAVSYWAARTRRVALLCKGFLGCGNTKKAAGNIARIAVEEGDSPDLLARDILKGGGQLGDRRAVERLSRLAVDLDRLMAELGIVLERNADGSLKRRGRGGHNLARSVGVVGGGVGFAGALRASVLRQERVDIHEEMMAFKLLVSGDRVRGVACYDLRAGQLVVFVADSVVLATGGLGWLYYPHTSNVREATGDGFALALEAGLRLVDMEQIQFHAFALTHPQAFVGVSCGEPVHGGAHGRIVDGSGRTVLESFSKMGRAEVCSAVARALRAGRATPHGGLTLDLTRNREADDFQEYVEYFGGKGGLLDRVRQAYGRKAAAFEESWDVAPTAHFAMGGIETDEDCSTGLRGLYAVGEVRGGIHGANRLGSVALTELLTCGAMVGKAVSEQEPSPEGGERLDEEMVRLIGAAVGEFEEMIRPVEGDRGRRPSDVMAGIQRTMWEKAGPIREGSDLDEALGRLQGLWAEARSLRVYGGMRHNFGILEALEVRLMGLAALAVVTSARARRHTLGSHVREDYPAQPPSRPLSIAVRMKDGDLVAGFAGES